MSNKVFGNILNAKTRSFGIFCFVIQSHTGVCSFIPQQNLLKNNFVLSVH